MSASIRSTLVRTLILVVTITLTWGALLIGQRRSDVQDLTVGDPSPLTFTADAPVTVTDGAATEREREAAAKTVEPIYRTDPDTSEAVIGRIEAVFDAIEEGVYRIEDPTSVTTTSEPNPTTTSTSTTSTTVGGEPPPGEETTTTTAPVVEIADLVGLVFLDADDDQVFDVEAGDAPLGGLQVTATDDSGQTLRTETDATGAFSIPGVIAGTVTITVNGADARLEHFFVSTGNATQTRVVRADTVLDVDPVGFAPLVRSLETQQQALGELYPNLQPSTVAVLTALATGDVLRTAQGLPAQLAEVRGKAIGRAADVLLGGLKSPQEVESARAALDVNWPPAILDNEYNPEASAAAADVVALNLQINEVLDTDATEQARETARAAVENVTVTFDLGEQIVAEGEEVTPVQAAAIEELGLLNQTGLEVAAMLAVVTILVLMLSFYLARFRQRFWANTKRVVLFGVLIALAAVVARLTAVLMGDNTTIGFLMPAATFGFMAAILFDARIGVIMSLAVGALTGVATRDPGLSMFALLSTMTPIPFVSSISARGDLRKAIVYTGLALAPMAAAIAWFFHGPDTVLPAALYGFLNGLFLSGVVGVTAVSFFEIIFDITTRLRLLDLTDRNHPALQMLEEKARGTFNHSLMVGTLGDRAARSIGANNLLVRASAYYHDLGKTENPQYFIENQFGISNPHDLLPPEESAELIRRHVIDGLRLAGVYRIPAEVADAVVSHHGDGIMRYFYHKAIELYGEANVAADDYRHYGHKPRTRETAILMMADALEGATRAVFADEDPTPEKIQRVVERVVGEKVADGQLSESALTLGELTKVKQAFVDALIGHYHQRIPYPNFPEPPGEPRGDGAGKVDRLDEEAPERDISRVELRP